ncbi:hypothetical protein KD050_00100 [Psychrobacillus sp. INOP01]|uniref:hypothetical protein n=1 Tax=Psychrobacillus sp. INOP01 TaxID=2829187 RepID=UPI001BAA0FAC|nr:hypothetical protein [Psychrobacillus sp. INOP01]QUG41746.1 hypothetical protein KD050_00100 [Psychrobacillus sp. INOP01]
MNNDFMSKVKKFLAFLLIASILFCVSYLFVYKFSFLPNGFDIEAVQKDNVSLKSFNFLGVEKDIITLSFSGNDTWRIDEIEYAVNRQKEFLWLLFSFVTVSGFLLIYKVLNGLKLWKAFLESNIIFAVLLPLLPVINSLNRIFDLIS